jgi:hypothetical protein
MIGKDFLAQAYSFVLQRRFTIKRGEYSGELRGIAVARLQRYLAGGFLIADRIACHN